MVINFLCLFSSVQLFSRVWLFMAPWIAAHQASLVHHQLPESTQTHVHWVDDAIQPPHPLSPSSPLALNLSQHQGLFQWVNSLHQLAKSTGASASATVLSMNIQDWFTLGWTGWISLQLKGIASVFQCHSSKASIVWCSAYFMVQLLHPYMTTRKIIILTIWTFAKQCLCFLIAV